MEAERGAPVPRRERDRVIDQVRFELLPTSHTRKHITRAYIDPQIGYLVVDLASDNRADEFTSNLQTALGALPVTFPAVHTRPAAALTDWVANGTMPECIELEHEAELWLPGEGGATVKVRNQELASREVFTHLEAGKEVVKLAVTYADRLRFVIDDKLNVRRLKFLEVILDEAGDVEADDAAARLDADFAVMSLELRSFIARVMEIFGGEDVVAMGVEP
jgi:recombination associated protein RdgC